MNVYHYNHMAINNQVPKVDREKLNGGICG